MKKAFTLIKTFMKSDNRISWLNSKLSLILFNLIVQTAPSGYEQLALY